MINFASAVEQYERNELLKKEDVTNLLEWCEQQPHLPRISELDALLFLQRCRYSNEAAKQRIDCFYSCRTHCPELFADCNPKLAEMQTILDIVLMCLLPQLTPNGERIFYVRYINTNPEVYSFNHGARIADMVALLHTFEIGYSVNLTVVIDMEGCRIQHILKIAKGPIAQFLFYLQNAAHYRIMQIHYVNSVYFVDKVLGIVKPFFKKKLLQRLFVHYGSNETIFEHIPRECLPKECGGDFESLTEFYAVQRKHLEKNAAFFVELEARRVDETKRPGKEMNSEGLFGLDGTFKMLNFD